MANFCLTKDIAYPTTPYAILSHTWGKVDEEVNFEDLKEGSGYHIPFFRWKIRRQTKDGYKKLRFCALQAARDGLQYFWVDTCCIDKSNSAELSEAINSMFRWYRNAARCYVYLSDVSTNDQMNLSIQPWQAAFENSRWFTRGWTLQELIAPSSVEFFCSNSNRLGDKKSLEGQLHMITGIPVSVLRGSPFSHLGFGERVAWARNRNTQREEDLAYSLLGIFDIAIPVIYATLNQTEQQQAHEEKLPPATSNFDKQLGMLQEMLKGNLSLAESNHAKRFGMLRQTLKGHSDWVWLVAFSPDSSLLASASEDKTVQLWAVTTGRLQQTLEGHSDSVWSVAFSPDSRLLASASKDKTVRLWHN